jgi:hypothetical protein
MGKLEFRFRKTLRVSNLLQYLYYAISIFKVAELHFYLCFRKNTVVEMKANLMYGILYSM